MFFTKNNLLFAVNKSIIDFRSIIVAEVSTTSLPHKVMKGGIVYAENQFYFKTFKKYNYNSFFNNTTNFSNKVIKRKTLNQIG